MGTVIVTSFFRSFEVSIPGFRISKCVFDTEKVMSNIGLAATNVTSEFAPICRDWSFVENEPDPKSTRPPPKTNAVTPWPAGGVIVAYLPVISVIMSAKAG
jgi:hypothetical protein